MSLNPIHAAGRRLLLAVGVIVLAELVFPASARAAAESSEETDRHVAALVAQLGAKEFATRERAQRELAKLGLAAFDALAEAENSDDAEIAAQAKYLVALMRVQWIDEEAPDEIKQILSDYATENEQARREDMKRLADLPDDKGVEWLCRLVRFESSQQLSKDAALAVMGQAVAAGDDAWKKRGELIDKCLQRSNRPGAAWLRTYLLERSDTQTALAQWAKHTEAEQETLAKRAQQSHYRYVVELLRRQIDALDRLGRTDEAVAKMQAMIELERGDSHTLAELVQWLAKRKAWHVVDDVARRFAVTFDHDAILLYTLAEARLAQGKSALAEEAAEKALKVNADRLNDHMELAHELYDRGWMQWSDREYRYVIDHGPPNAQQVIRSRILLSENLHDRLEDKGAAEVLGALVELLAKDAPAVRYVQQGLKRTTESIRSRAMFFEACHQKSAGNHAKSSEILEKAIAQDPADADVLIALYRREGLSAVDRKRTVGMIQKAVKELRQKIEEDSNTLQKCNELAWLVANTEGDQDEALSCAQRAVEIGREADPQQIGGLVDTLAHCYFARGDYESAVKHQTEAVQLEPHSQQIARQLELFKRKLAEKQGKGKN